ncbi:MAG TPA: MbcA/ParS/Xre antitoxin family protein [Bryobacteraceae bacterium]|nr:MbcA/ParS/Xre antitoxin family protein [Bryobacteraceae bacterium]
MPLNERIHQRDSDPPPAFRIRLNSPLAFTICSFRSVLTEMVASGTKTIPVPMPLSENQLLAGRTTAFATRWLVRTQVASSVVAERLPAISGSAGDRRIDPFHERGHHHGDGDQQGFTPGNVVSGMRGYRSGVYTPDMEKLAIRELRPVSPARRRDPKVRRQMSGPAIRTYFNIANAWQLSNEEQRALLGWPPESTFFKYKSGDTATLSFDTLTRISLVLGIYKDLHILYPELALADRWIKLPNSNLLFGGQAALDLMIANGMDGLYQVRRLLDGRRGGWN